MIPQSLLFTDLTQINIVDKQKAELYMQIYQYAAEDFLTTADANTYSTLLSQYLANMEAKLARVFAILASHNHMAPKGPTGPPLTGGISWQVATPPVIKFTSGVKPNLFTNMVVPGVAMEGAPSTGLRRALLIPRLVTPSVPPLIEATLKSVTT